MDVTNGGTGSGGNTHQYDVEGFIKYTYPSNIYTEPGENYVVTREVSFDGQNIGST